VACVLGRSLDLEISYTHLDQLEGTGGVAVVAVPGVGWHTIDEVVLMRTSFENREQWPLYLAFDVLLANVDRHQGNILVELNDPEASRVTGVARFIDYGFGGCGHRANSATASMPPISRTSTLKRSTGLPIARSFPRRPTAGPHANELLLRSRSDRAPDVTAGVPTARRRDDGRRS
jgi:hypothetical protein